MPKEIVFMGTPLRISGQSEVLSAIDSGDPVRIATVNPEFILEAQRNADFRNALGRMSHCTVDGSGLSFALRILNLVRHAGIPATTYHGSDLVEDLFVRYSNGQKSFYLLGGDPGVAEKAVSVIQKRHPGLRFVGFEDGGTHDGKKMRLDPGLIQRILGTKPDILLVGFGAPKQELWIDLASDLAIPTMIGVGGTFDFYVRKRRAPRLMRRLALEWLYRALSEPGHAKRAYRAAVHFPLSFIVALGRGTALQK